MVDRLIALITSVGCAWALMFGSAAAQVGGPCRQFTTVPTPGLEEEAEFAGVVAISRFDAWAVGNQAGEEATLREHWDGHGWEVVPGPDPGQENTLEAVTATSSSDVWAVGATFDGVRDHGLIEHWDGVEWTASPNPANAGLLGVAALSPTDAWAVGEAQTILHWDGLAWRVVTHLPLEEADLHGVAAISSDDVWFVGAVEVEGGGENTLALHWDGTLVSNVTTQIPEADHSELAGVVGLASNDVWAVGEMELEGRSEVVIEHWDGTAWHLMPGPNPGEDENELRGITALSRNNLWAVGAYASEEIDHPLAIHWNGREWTTVGAEEFPTDTITEFNAISARNPRNIWAVGAHGAAEDAVAPLAENVRRCG